jgi:hypothetical protein
MTASSVVSARSSCATAAAAKSPPNGERSHVQIQSVGVIKIQQFYVGFAADDSPR